MYIANTITGQIVADLPGAPQIPGWRREINGTGSLSPQIVMSSDIGDEVRDKLNEPFRWTVVYAYGNTICQAGLLTGYSTDDTQQPPVATLNTMTLWDFLAKKRRVAYPGQPITDPAADIVFAADSPDPA